MIEAVALWAAAPPVILPARKDMRSLEADQNIQEVSGEIAWRLNSLS